MNVLVNVLARVADNDIVPWQRMRELCLGSYQENLADLDRIESIDIRVETHSELLRQRIALYRDVWAQGHNVLAVDLDTICVRPTEIFGRFDDMRMFGLTNQDAPSRQDIPKGRYMNAGVLYLPQTMAPALWTLSAAWIDEWDDDMWSYDQYVWNRMFWTQGLDDWWHPELNYAQPCDKLHDGDLPNGDVRWWQANIIHFHASRNPAEAVRAMEFLR